MKIIIPSHKRHDRVITAKLVTDPIICVPKSQLLVYQKYNEGVEVIAHPDSVVGLPAKRQWIYEKFNEVWMLDDDLKCIMFTNELKSKKLSPEEVRDALESIFDMACQLGVYLFGLSKNPMARHYFPHHPIHLTGFISGGAHGVREPKKSGLYYNTDLINNDFWISLLNAYKHRKTLVDTRYLFQQKDTFKNQGGLAEFRTIKAMENDYNELKRYFGDSINLKSSVKDAKVKVKFALTGHINL